MNIDALLAEMGDDLPEGFVEDLARIRNALYSSSITDLYTVQGEGFVLHLQGAVVGVNAMIGIRIESPNIQKLLHGSCNVFSLFRLTWVLGQLEVEALEDILEDDEILEAVHMIVTKGEEADEDAYDLLDFELTQLVSDSFGQSIPAAVVEFALAHTSDLCPHHLTHEVGIGTIEWEDRFSEYGILLLDEAEGLESQRQVILNQYFDSGEEPSAFLKWLDWFDRLIDGVGIDSAEALQMDNAFGLAISAVIIMVEERVPTLTQLTKTAIIGGLLLTAANGSPKQSGGTLVALMTSIQMVANWLVTAGYCTVQEAAFITVEALGAAYTIKMRPKVRTLQYGPW